MKNPLRLIPESLRSKGNIAIMLTAAVLIEVTSIVQYFYAKEGIRKEVEHRAESELKAKSLEIRNVKNIVEVAVANKAWSVEQRLAQPDSLLAVTRKLLSDNENIVTALPRASNLVRISMNTTTWSGTLNPCRRGADTGVSLTLTRGAAR